jgi:hypothetical protein
MGAGGRCGPHHWVPADSWRILLFEVTIASLGVWEYLLMGRVTYRGEVVLVPIFQTSTSGTLP